jgi:hypothetical protein
MPSQLWLKNVSNLKEKVAPFSIAFVYIRAKALLFLLFLSLMFLYLFSFELLDLGS